MAQHGQSTKDIADLFLISIPGRLEIVDHDKSGLFHGIKFRNDRFQSYLFVSRYLQLSVQKLEKSRWYDIASLQGTQTMSAPGNRSDQVISVVSPVKDTWFERL